MAFAARATIDGLDDLMRKLDALKKGKRNAILRKATTKATKIVLAAARANLKGHGLKTGSLLYKSIGSKIGVTKKGVVYGIVGPRTGFKTTKGGGRVQTTLGAKYKATGQNPTKYAHLVEGGRKEVRPVKAKVLMMKGADGTIFFAKRAKAVKPRPFLKPALNASLDKIRDVMAKEIGEGLTKLAMKG